MYAVIFVPVVIRAQNHHIISAIDEIAGRFEVTPVEIRVQLPHLIPINAVRVGPFDMKVMDFAVEFCAANPTRRIFFVNQISFGFTE